MKKNRGLVILTTLVTLIPMLVGLLLWDKLPDQMPTHWNAAGEIDGWSSKEFAIFGLYGIVAGCHLLCWFGTVLDPKNRGHNEKNLWLVLWICPVISLVLGAMTYCAAFGIDVSVERIMPVLVGLIFVVIGNYMPKFRQNSTMGIKIPWTLADEGNWNATHRFAGIVWVIGGVLVAMTAFVGNVWIMLAVMIAMVALPVGYSYNYFRKHDTTEQ